MLVKSLSHLKSLANNGNGDFIHFYILLAGGITKGWKRILYDPSYDEFSVINEIDESYQEFKSSDINKASLLVEAINKQSLFRE